MTDELPPLITDPADYDGGYFYVPGWDDYQHRDAIRTGPPLKWIKDHVAQLDHDEYLALSAGARGVLHDVRLLVGRVGNGRVSARTGHVQRTLGYVSSAQRRHATGHIASLIHAGFLEVRAGKLPARCQQAAGTEERREGGAPTAHTPTRRKRARAGVAEGSPATQNGHVLVAGVELDPDTIRAMRGGYRPGTLTDQQIDAIQAELTEEPL